MTDLFSDCESILRGEGYNVSKLSDSLLAFKAYGFQVLLDLNADDPHFLRVIALFPKVEGVNRQELLEAANQICADRKATKMFLMEEDVWISAETLIEDTPLLIDILPRLVRMVGEASIEFIKKTR